MENKKSNKIKKKYTKKEEAYIQRLMANGTDRIRAEWYLNAMQTWTKEDYEEYDRFHLEMFGEDPEKYGMKPKK